jgi:hypothetical protein
MVKHVISIAGVGGAAALSACFGDPPAPSAPDQVTQLFSTQPSQDCSSGTYIGPVAIGSDQGFVSFLAYTPAANCGGGGGGQIQAPQDVFAFDLAQPGAPTKIGSAGMTDAGGHVQIAAKPMGAIHAVWAFGQMSTNLVEIEPSGATVGSSQGGVNVAAGIAVAGTDVFVGVANGQTTSGREVTDPSYPSGGEGGILAQSGAIFKNAASFMTWQPSCSGLDRCIVANATTLAIGEHVGTEDQISAIDTTTGNRTKVFSATTGDTPHGLDIDDHYIAWSTALSCPSGNTNGSCRVSDCGVFVYDLTDPNAKPIPLLSTSKFACIDAKLVNGYVYFSIVDVYKDYQQLYAPGIGRVNIADRTLETLDLGIRFPGAGPRRVFPVGDDLLVVDPFVMARMPASALDGKHDFTP